MSCAEKSVMVWGSRSREILRSVCGQKGWVIDGDAVSRFAAISEKLEYSQQKSSNSERDSNLP